MIISVLILAVIGFGVAVYAYYVESKLKKNPDYKPACDLSDRISCSKVIQSPYASIFSISNAQAGIVYYILVAILALFRLKLLLVIVTALGVLASAVLAYILYFKIKSVCLVCTSIYIINVLLLIFSIL